MTKNQNLIAAGLTVAIMASTSGAASAVDTQQTWQGLATVTNATSQCATSATLGELLVSVYRPFITAGDTDTYLSFLGTRSAIALLNTTESTNHQMHGSGNNAATAINGRAKIYPYSSTYALTITPASVIATTPTVNIKGKIFNLWNLTGCTITITGSYQRRPD